MTYVTSILFFAAEGLESTWADEMVHYTYHARIRLVGLRESPSHGGSLEQSSNLPTFFSVTVVCIKGFIM